MNSLCIGRPKTRFLTPTHALSYEEVLVVTNFIWAVTFFAFAAYTVHQVSHNILRTCLGKIINPTSGAKTVNNSSILL
jgi:hypothetical protein